MYVNDIVVRSLGQRDYLDVFHAMREFTQSRNENTLDELWCVEHPCVYTIGKTPRIHQPNKIGEASVIQTDRGGDLTYHAPGQVVLYPLVNLVRRHLFVKHFVTIIESSVINTLATFGIHAFTHAQAPGVYVHCNGGIGEFSGMAKIASLGIKVSRGCSYHGVSLNVDMDLSGFAKIAPCGYSSLRMTDMKRQGVNAHTGVVKKILIENFLNLISE